MLGFYNVSVILTYLGLSSAVCGIMLAMDGRAGAAVALLMLSGVCDMFDGKIARATKRSEDAKTFGIQIDSLCDLVCFGVLPAVIAHCFGVGGVFGCAVLALYVLGAVIRLGYFNVIEQKRQQTTDEEKDSFHGLPVTTVAMLMPAYLAVSLFAFGQISAAVTTAFMLIVALLFVVDLHIRNPRWPGCRYIAATALVAAAVAVFCLVGRTAG